MDENLELLEFIYQNSEMSVFSLTKLINELNGRDNKIKKLVEEELKGFEKFLKESEKLLQKNKCNPKENGLMAKMGASMGIKKETMADNSDAAIAHMLVEGNTMGIVDMETKINNYKGTVDKKILKLAEDYLEYTKEQVEELKKFM